MKLKISLDCYNIAFLECSLVSYKVIVHNTSLVAMGFSSTLQIVNIYVWYQIILSIIGIVYLICIDIYWYLLICITLCYYAHEHEHEDENIHHYYIIRTYIRTHVTLIIPKCDPNLNIFMSVHTFRNMGGQSSQSFGHLVELKMREDKGENFVEFCVIKYSDYYIVRKRYETNKNTFLILIYIKAMVWRVSVCQDEWALERGMNKQYKISYYGTVEL